MQPDCDVLVLGAGPAGSALAKALAGAGFAVLLADQKAFPRPKPCGEFLSPQCTPYLRALGVDEGLRRAGARHVHGMDLRGFGAHAHGRFLAVGGAATTAGCAVRREVLDQQLLDAARSAGARWLERHALDALVRDAGGTVCGAVLRTPDRGRRTVRARWVVGADGVHSRTARQLGVQRPLRWLDRFALVTRYAGVPPAPAAEVHMFPGGYFAATAVDGDRFHVNLVVDRRELRAHADGWDAFVAARLQETPAFAARLSGARRVEPWRGTGPLAFTTRRQTAPGAALVGDACGYVDPLTGEGIYFALFTARALAQALGSAFAAPARAGRAMAAYVRERRREVAPRLLLARLLQRGLRHPWIAARVLAVLEQRPALADLLITLTGDAAHPRDLLRPSFWCGLRRERASARAAGMADTHEHER
jgi:flavin-dependent dehydrogenase